MRDVRRRTGHIRNRWWKPNPWGPNARAAALASRRRKNAERKAAALLVIKQKAMARANQQAGTLKDKFGVADWSGADTSDSTAGRISDKPLPDWAHIDSPLNLRWNDDGSLVHGGIDQTGRDNADQPVRLVPPSKPVGFSVPDQQAVFYSNGSWYDSNGLFVAKAPPSPSSGPVFRNGVWYDAKTGRTLGRSGVI